MKESRKQEILEVFEQLVARFGLNKVTMQDVAREVGISVGAIYLDFKNKNALIAAIEHRWKQHIEAYNVSIVNSSFSPEEKLYKLIVEHSKGFSLRIREDLALFELLMGRMHVSYIRNKAPRDIRQEIFDSMVKGIEKIFEEGCTQNVFEIEDINLTAQLFIEAFGEYFSAPTLIRKQHEEVVKNADAMFALLMKAIKKK